MALAAKWRSVQGQDHWEGMLEPLDKDLCQELIRYAQFIQVVYDSLNKNPVSKANGLSRYAKSELFDKLHVKANYTIRNFFYCTTDLETLLGKVVETVLDFTDPNTSWFGYVAVSDDEETRRLGRRDIVVVFRGTQQDIEWASNILNSFHGQIGKPEPKSGLPPLQTPTSTPTGFLSGLTNIQLPWEKVLIANRWLAPYTGKNPQEPLGFGKKSAREQISAAVTSLLNEYKAEEMSITVTGHSLGASLATVCAYDIANEKLNVNPSTKKVIPVTCFPFASPYVGNEEFKTAAEKIEGLRILRVTNIWDLVPKVPPLLWGYRHVGIELTIDTSKSSYLKFPTTDPFDHHNLQAHCHLVGNKVEPLKYHHLELVNKSSNLLKDSIVPGNWWVVENTDVVVNEAGRWALKEYNISADNNEYN
ncbi:hypothetical protein SELMODRAFT_445229 [Selaginella moellendorffii]|uniref:Phospholipase A1 n=1 Tax=Selaginella moellendorffii TaxID=88036 RepID=D8SGZ3_SELML|nr:phospholipase A1-IIdelta [Selaginella moellendorffii]EFJ16290.1 hypothetical protein SELMODRAFT_445229 [Selaginella moellendorffii]|eukprot:XP_002982537.1 phospholipase A1-IIdelta [Selaginella moellendorffii]